MTIHFFGSRKTRGTEIKQGAALILLTTSLQIQNMLKVKKNAYELFSGTDEGFKSSFLYFQNII